MFNANRHVALLYDPVMAVADRIWFAPYRHRLAENLTGRVLEIGAGTGSMQPWYASFADHIDLVALEPDKHMRKRGSTRPVAAHWAAGVGEQLPFRTATFDAVVLSLVLCTVDSPAQVIAEVARVLKPQGDLRVFEHIADTGLHGAIQKSIRPVWRRLAGGCDPHREISNLLSERTEFEPIIEERVQMGIPPIRPFHFGQYRRTSSSVPVQQ